MLAVRKTRDGFHRVLLQWALVLQFVSLPFCTSLSASKSFMCHICQALLSTKGSLKVHMRLHTGAKPFKCPHCDQRFRTSGHRKSHIEQHLKPNIAKKRRPSTRSSQQNDQVVVGAASAAGLNMPSDGTVAANQVINLDQSMLQAQGILPITITDALGNVTGLVDPNQGTPILQGLEGIQLHVTGSVGQGIQISGMDPNMLTQTLQIDSSLLQHLQQQGNVNLTINPNMITQMPSADQGLVSVQQPTIQDAVNPNIVIQPAATQAVVEPSQPQQISVSSDMAGVSVLNFGTGSLQEQQQVLHQVVQPAEAECSLNMQVCEWQLTLSGLGRHFLDNYLVSDASLASLGRFRLYRRASL